MSKAREQFEAKLWERVLDRFAAGVPEGEVGTKHLEEIYIFTVEETAKSYHYGKRRAQGANGSAAVPRIVRPTPEPEKQSEAGRESRRRPASRSAVLA